MLDANEGRDEQRKLFPSFAGMPSRMAGRRERLDGENVRRREGAVAGEGIQLKRDNKH
jgi:hypothetical protein